MRILAVHNAYQQYGGEDSVFAAETELLRGAGHHVDTLVESNDSIQGFAGKAAAALLTAHNPSGRRKMAMAIAASRPDVVHVHNFFPRLSPSIFDACAAAGVPAVWTLHNYRIACANGLLFRDGSPCEDCLGGSSLPAVARGCYRGSRVGSAVVASMIGYHQLAGTWRTKVARFIALSEFARGKLAVAGLPADRLVVKPNFVADPAGTVTSDGQRAGFVYVGRLSVEKGVRTLVEAWRGKDGRGIEAPLTIIGDGPELPALRAMAAPNVTFAGHRSRNEVYAAIGGASALIVPSQWYEGLPMIVIEAMALGTPIIASRIGTLGEVITPGISGAHFDPGDAGAIQRVVSKLLTRPEQLKVFGKGARQAYERCYSPETNLQQLLTIYRAAAETVPDAVG